MSFFTVSVAYTATNFLLSLIILQKSNKNQITKFYFFCVNCLVAMGVSAFYVSQPIEIHVKSFLENVVLFLYSLYPFFFIHFITLFVRHKVILRSVTLNIAIYVAGLFSYTMLLLGYIPRPILSDGIVTQSGYIFYLTWMSVFFSIGIAMLFEISRQFREKMRRADLVLISCIFLLLILPGPFTDSVLFGVFRLSIEIYFYICTFAIMIAVYFIFRHKIIVNTMTDAIKSALEVMNDVLISMDDSFQIEMVRGKAVSSLLGYQENELIGKTFDTLIDQKTYLAEYRSYVQRKKMRESYFDTNVICKDGKLVPMNFSFSPTFVDDEVSGFVSVGRDITEHKKLEEEFRQAQKMESIGTLAGGIAHDFNNILQIIMVNTSSLRRLQSTEPKLTKVIDINVKAVERGSKLVHQILTFARKTEIQFIPLDANNIIQDLIKMLSETFPKTISFSLNLDPSLPRILADHNQMNQVLLNLCVNARDAMPDGGSISINSEIILGWEVKQLFSEAKGDRYVCISVTDTGHGMDENVRRRLFEPFFTTKEPGKGTGLGLAVVYGIVTAHHGFIHVRSSVGIGTTFYIYFPVSVDSQEILEGHAENQKEVPRGSETLLLVEDEDVLLQSLSASLQSYGYKIVTARDGYEAIDVFRKNQKEISLIVMDIGLPKLSGWDAFQKIKEISQNIKIIVASGYLDPKIKSEKLMAGISDFIYKPYDPDKILRCIRNVLDVDKA